jgi:hypothetical protein
MTAKLSSGHVFVLRRIVFIWRLRRRVRLRFEQGWYLIARRIEPLRLSSGDVVILREGHLAARRSAVRRSTWGLQLLVSSHTLRMDEPSVPREEGEKFGISGTRQQNESL